MLQYIEVFKQLIFYGKRDHFIHLIQSQIQQGINSISLLDKKGLAYEYDRTQEVRRIIDGYPTERCVYDDKQAGITNRYIPNQKDF